ncbi:MAG TPA: hypothetical protein VL490_05390, partial [Mucilaginibacter sp.]|nr:hypothetical protein [Mucilaginibacter sp.]
MKILFAIFTMVFSSYAIAQTGTLHAGVYNWSSSEIKKTAGVEKRQVLAGKTLDLKTFEIYTLTLPAGKTFIPPATDDKFERLIVVKSGTVKLSLKDTAQIVGFGSLALVLAGDKISFQNTSNQPAAWYVIRYESVNPPDIKRG